MSNEYKRVLTVQDISCVGQCSLTVALPILSACGLETCVLPSAVLSTHTGGFSNYTFRDLTDDMEPIMNHWISEKIGFDAIYTGYLGSERQTDIVKKMFESLGKPDTGLLKAVDPAMADNGRLYPGFDSGFVDAMKRLCASADIILPNITEACLLTDTGYRTEYDEDYVKKLCEKLSALGAKKIVLTGVGYNNETTGVLVCDDGTSDYYCHRKISKGCHGTGDIFASAFIGSYVRGVSLIESAKIAADFTVGCIERTIKDKNHWYGAEFEQGLGDLIGAISEKV